MKTILYALAALTAIGAIGHLVAPHDAPAPAAPADVVPATLTAPPSPEELPVGVYRLQDTEFACIDPQAWDRAAEIIVSGDRIAADKLVTPLLLAGACKNMDKGTIVHQVNGKYSLARVEVRPRGEVQTWWVTRAVVVQ